VIFNIGIYLVEESIVKINGNIVVEVTSEIRILNSLESVKSLTEVTITFYPFVP